MRHFFIKLVLPLYIFIAVKLIFLIDWRLIPISSIKRIRGISLEHVYKKLFEWINLFIFMCLVFALTFLKTI